MKSPPPPPYDFLVVGAGYAGLNAVAALQHACPSATVLVLEQREEAGGCWNSLYSFVRLHQPAFVFGVSGQAASWGPDARSELASRHGVLNHFQKYASSLPPTVAFLFSASFVRCERGDAGLLHVDVAFATRETTRVAARHVIDARGADLKLPQLACLREEHERVAECYSEELRRVVQSRRGEACCYVVVGGGKTGCDAVTYLAKHAPPSSRVLLLQGRPLYFIRRDRMFPSGNCLKEISVPVASEVFLDWCKAYDGSNALELLRAAERDGLLMRVGEGEPQLTNLGVDGARTTLVLRSGKTIELGAEQRVVLVKAVGRLVEDYNASGEPNVWKCMQHPIQPDGRVRIGAHFGFTGPSAYLLTILLARGKLEELPFRGYNRLGTHNVDNLFYMSTAIVWHALQAARLVSPLDMMSCTIMFDKFGPMPRQLFALSKLLLASGKLEEQAHKLLHPLRPGVIEANGVGGGQK
ncbi:hypothetical protein AB1Y20_012007 [Prymnesium parvum]|uniref:FAD/NAD(P)-binding domain-containing protein n=1 Tax=Prymnesium parvum TaxID=97485 RepID=A0AB34IN97_PRYPA